MSLIPFPSLAGASSGTVPGLLVSQLTWLMNGGFAARRVFTLWLLELPAPAPAGTLLILSQARQVTARHLSQLEQLVAMPAAETDDSIGCRGIDVLLREGESAFEHGNPTTDFFGTLHRTFASFAIACGSAAETAMVIERFDLAAVLASWAAAARGLQEEIEAQHPVAA